MAGSGNTVHVQLRYLARHLALVGPWSVILYDLVYINIFFFAAAIAHHDSQS